MPSHFDPSTPEPDEPAPTERVTRLLNAAAAGDQQAPNELFSLIYDQLRAIARKRMSGERPDHTLDPTALVNEAYFRLVGKPGTRWTGRGHFFAAAAQAMRQILVDHARAHNADKRGAGRKALSISSIVDLGSTVEPSGFLALDDAIVRLDKVDAQAAAVVRLRFFTGLSEPDVAEALNISDRTVRRDWAFARGWLRDALERESQ
jgi:RNA polymerase sigma factor (TIGR02999 family)